MSSLRWIALAAAAVVVLGAAGWKLHERGSSSSYSFTREQVASEFTSMIRGRILAQGGRMSRDLQCVQDGDSRHYRCLARFRLGGRRYAITMTVTCDPGNGRCLSEPGTVVPTG